MEMATNNAGNSGLKVRLPTSQHSSQNTPEYASLAIVDAANTIATPGVPSFRNLEEQRQWMKEHCAAAFRLFGKSGYGVGFAGHISLRDPIDPTKLWFNPIGYHFSCISASDLVLVNEEGFVVEGGHQYAVNAAAFAIHSEIHKARPDVNAVCHSHSCQGVAYSVFGKPLEAITQDSAYFYNRHTVYESFGGIVLAAEEGSRIAKALGPTNHSIILQNHGLLTTGKTVDEAAFLFHMMEHCCKVQMLTDMAVRERLQKTYLPEEEAEFTAIASNLQDSLYLDFQPEYQLICKETNGDFKR